MNEYQVQVSNTFEAETPEEAVQQMACWLVDCAFVAGYRVFLVNPDTFEREEQSLFIDAEKIIE